MNKKIVALATGLLIAVLVFSNAFAGGGVKISSATFSLGSLIAKGYVSGLGTQDVIVQLDASGIPEIICTNNGGNQVPGQSSPKVTASGTDVLPGSDPARKNGKAPYSDETQPPAPLTWQQAGCPNSNWTAQITFVYWTNAKLSVFAMLPDGTEGSLLTYQNYACTTTKTSVSCTPVP